MAAAARPRAKTPTRQDNYALLSQHRAVSLHSSRSPIHQLWFHNCDPSQRYPFSHLRFQSLDFEPPKLKITFKTSRDHLLILDSSRLSVEISGISSGKTAVGAGAPLGPPAVCIASGTGVCEKTLFLCKPLPCNPAAETAVQPLVWWFRS